MLADRFSSDFTHVADLSRKFLSRLVPRESHAKRIQSNVERLAERDERRD